MVNEISNNNPGEITAAYTNQPQDYVTEIQFNQQYFNSDYSDITYARTMVHIVLHAEVMRKLISVNQYPVINQNLESDFPTYWKYWVQYSYDLDNETNIQNFMHNHMAEKYRGRIINGLKEFDSKNGSSHTEWEYKALSWYGLKGTTAWLNFKLDNPTLAEKYMNYGVEEASAGGCPKN